MMGSSVLPRALALALATSVAIGSTALAQTPIKLPKNNFTPQSTFDNTEDFTDGAAMRLVPVAKVDS